MPARAHITMRPASRSGTINTDWGRVCGPAHSLQAAPGLLARAAGRRVRPPQRPAATRGAQIVKGATRQCPAILQRASVQRSSPKHARQTTPSHPAWSSDPTAARSCGDCPAQALIAGPAAPGRLCRSKRAPRPLPEPLHAGLFGAGQQGGAGVPSLYGPPLGPDVRPDGSRLFQAQPRGRLRHAPRIRSRSSPAARERDAAH